MKWYSEELSPFRRLFDLRPKLFESIIEMNEANTGGSICHAIQTMAAMHNGFMYAMLASLNMAETVDPWRSVPLSWYFDFPRN